MVEILALVLQHDEQAVLEAAELALKRARMVDGKPFGPPAFPAPKALTLTTELPADVERYDALLR